MNKQSIFEKTFNIFIKVYMYKNLYIFEKTVNVTRFNMILETRYDVLIYSYYLLLLLILKSDFFRH